MFVQKVFQPINHPIGPGRDKYEREGEFYLIIKEICYELTLNMNIKSDVKSHWFTLIYKHHRDVIDEEKHFLLYLA